MAKGLRDIKRKIKTVQNTKQITKAMEMVAASKLRKAQQAAESARPYADKIREVISAIASGASNVKHPMLQAREVKRTGYMVVTSDRGLAGGYNANVLRKVVTAIRERHATADEYVIFVIGRKGRDFFRKRGMPIADEEVNLPDSPLFADIKDIASKAVRYFAEGQYDELNIVYNQFNNAISQTPVEKKLLPVTDLGKGEGGQTGAKANYEYEPDAEAVLDVLLPKYAETLVYSALLEGKASEFGARMTAMGNATKNATSLIGSLTLEYNRARQASITQEITEIVAGANAAQG